MHRLKEYSLMSFPVGYTHVTTTLLGFRTELAGGPHLACCLFLYSWQTKNGFYIFI